MLVYHYTKSKNLELIILQDRIHFKASHYSTYGDNDYGWTTKVARPIIASICEQCHESFDKEWDFDPFIISFAEKRNDRYMWRSFGNYNKGIMLALDSKLIAQTAMKDSLPDAFMKCKYFVDNERRKQWLRSCRIEDFPVPSNCLQDDLMIISSFLLPKRYKREREYRYVVPIHRGFYVSWNPETKEPKVEDKPLDKYTDKDGNLYVDFPKVTLKEVVIGRKCKLTVAEVRDYLSQNGYDLNHVTVTKLMK